MKDAIDDILRRPSALPSSAGVLAVRARCEDAASEGEAWTESQPPRKEKEKLMRRVLGLHLEVARLERIEAET